MPYWKQLSPAVYCSLCSFCCNIFLDQDADRFLTVSYLGMSWPDVWHFCIIWIVAAAGFCLVQQLLDRISIQPTTGKLSAAWIFVLILMAWLPFFLAFYPGNLSPDSYSSINQALTWISSTAHPVLFTLLVKLCLWIGLRLFDDMNAAVAVLPASAAAVR